jgi:hypothetical protein
VADTIYPIPTTAPATLAIGADTGFVQLAEHIGTDPGLPGIDVTFIRIAMSGAAAPPHPKVELRAVNKGTLTEGAAVTIDPTLDTAPPGKGLADGTNPTDAASAYFSPPFTDNVYLLKVPIFISGTALKLRITNLTGVQRDFVWVVADSDANSMRPWIHVSPATRFYNVLINQTASLTTQSVNVSNRGTGPLTVSATTPALPAAPVSGGFGTSALPLTVAPNSSAAVPIAFGAPATPGTVAAATFAFNGDGSSTFGPGHNRDLSLSAKTQALELALVLDDSGSMNLEPDGDSIPPAPGPPRWDSLETAANEFLDMLAIFGAGKGKFGVARFPASDPGNPSTFDVVKPIAIPGSMSAQQTAISNVTPGGWTPMGDGLNRVLTPGAGYFANDATSIDLNRRWILLMTDGAHNDGTHHPLEFVSVAEGGTAAAGASLNDKKIKVFSVGYGVEGKAEVDFNLLQKISQGSFEDGNMVKVESSGLSTTQLAGAFRAAIKAGLVSVSSPTDPGGTLTSARPEARHKVIITPYDTKVAFVVNWNTKDARRVRLHLLTPTCDLLTPESAPGSFDSGEIGFSGASRYQLYRISGDYLRNAADPAHPRYGTWTMVVFSDELRERGSEYYEYDVIVESSLQMELQRDRPVYYPGDTVGISAILTVNGKPITQANVSLKVTMPGLSFNNWLAAVKISAGEYREAQATVSQLQLDANPIYVKAFAAERKGIIFHNFKNTVTIPLTDPDNDGVYTGSFSQSTTPGSYVLYVTAVGTTEDGVVFRREGSLNVTVEARPHPSYTLVDIQYGTLNPATGLMSATVHVRPLDAFGNVVLLDPAAPGGIVLNATGARVDPLTTLFDGTYTTTLSYPPGKRPSISLAVGGETVISSRPIAAVDRLQYVDRVLDFKLGLEGEPGANRHTDSKAVLGDIGPKPSGEFVSLGAYGSLTVAVDGQEIVAQGDDDITVFVHPDSDPRSYLVEASPADGSGTWVEIGKSAGITQSFSLGKASLGAVSAVRLTDTSGRTRGPDMKSIESPGVSFRGVGFTRVRPASKPDSTGHGTQNRGCLLAWLLGLLGRSKSGSDKSHKP